MATTTPGRGAAVDDDPFLASITWSASRKTIKPGLTPDDVVV
jgi:hypothetical protein